MMNNTERKKIKQACRCVCDKMRYVIYLRETSHQYVEQMLDALKKSGMEKTFIMFGENNKIELLDPSFSLKRFVKCTAMKLSMRFR